jgi:hypothetical protein
MQMNTAMDRELEYWPPGATQSIPIQVRIGIPEPHPKYEWESTITIQGFPGKAPYSKGMTGGDPIEALSYALAIAPLHLRLMVQRGGRLTWRGKENLGFPSMFSEPTQDWQVTPAGGGPPWKVTIRIGLPERIDDQWSVLVSCIDCRTWKAAERRVQAGAWSEVLERAAVAVPELLREHVEKAGGGTLVEATREHR